MSAKTRTALLCTHNSLPRNTAAFLVRLRDEKEIHSTPTSSREHANMVRDRFPQRVPSSWSAGLLLWRLDSVKYRESPVNGRIVKD
jgi:hypothetical protein